MTLTRKDAAATLLTGFAVLVFLATHEAWNLPLIGDSRRWAAVVIFLLGAVTCGLGTRTQSMPLLFPVLGTAAIGLYAAALAGVGIAVGGLIGPAFAAPTVVGLTLVTWLVDLIGGDLGIPDWIHQLALSTHMGQPMVGVWNATGIVACLVLAAGGLAIGTLAFTRRDLRS